MLVLLNHIDAPDEGQPYFRRSKKHLSTLVYKKQVTLTIQGYDEHHIALADIKCQQTNVNRNMVSKGYAWWYYFYQTDMTFLPLQEAAKQKKKGLWADKNPQEPWKYRELRKKQTRIIVH